MKMRIIGIVLLGLLVAVGTGRPETKSSGTAAPFTIETASTNSRGKAPCPQPQSPRPVGQSNSKKKYITPAIAPPVCTPASGGVPVSHG